MGAQPATQSTTQSTARKVSQSVLAHQSHAAREMLVSRWRLQRIEIRRLLLQVLSGELLAFSAAEQTQALRALCSELVDYVSTGHFEIYGRVLPRKLQSNAELHALLQHIFHSIGKSTDAVLGFNDRYQRGVHVLATAAFRQLLIRLSRGLLLRFALEEQLLELCGH
jgi:regulator of sigma D